jgi:predicted ribosome quality control (RQC) complex YloA/Tae2 family protein
VTSISQVGTDRIIEFTFSDGLYKLFLEFYAGGNIVLTDGDLKVLALLRNVEEGAEHERLRVGLQYNLSLRQNYGGIPELTKERVRAGLQKAVDRQQEPGVTGKKAKKASKDALRKALAVSITECPPLLVDHAMHVANFDASLKPEQVLANEELLDKLHVALQEARQLSETITESDPVKGYILAKANPAAPKDETEGSDKPALLYDDFHPFRPKQFENSDYTVLEFEGFNKAVDEFFSSIEGQKLESKLHERELLAKKKLDQARQEHANRIGGLQQVQELNVRKAEAILANVHRVEEAILAVNGLIVKAMDWSDIAELIRREQVYGNPVAKLIQLPLKLHENTITLLLDEAHQEDDEDGDDEGNETSSASEDSDDEDTDEDTAPKKVSKAPQSASKKLAIDIDLSMSPWANSSAYFDQKKSAAGKEQRTVQASEKALKSHERKVAEDLKKGLKQEKDVLRPVRKQHWFEKFIYFISSDGYLVLGGKDAQQTEILYKRWLRKGDVFVHADLKGAVPLIIKNKPSMPDAPIPPSTLSQAGHLSVSTSEAWESKAVMSAWWVNSNKVSKTGQTGEFLPPGIFEIKGKKEFLPPAQLIVGLAAMFEISEESKARHRKHRVFDASVETRAETMQDREDKDDQEKEGDSDSDSDSDEDFPDAKIGSASEDEFPDAKIEEEAEESDTDTEEPKQANPLESRNKADLLSEDEGDESEQKDVAAAVTDIQATSEHQQDATEAVGEGGTQAKAGPRHLSARERRLLRKGQPLNTPSPASGSASVLEGSDDDGASNQHDNRLATQKGPGSVFSQASKARSQGPLPRGKRGKAKKLAAKYADQDEEERALAMRLLGSQTGQKAAEEEAKAKRAKEEEAQANKQRRREQHLRAQAAGKAAEEARRAAHEGQDDADDDDEAAKAQMLDLDAFTGRPLPGDEILAAIPVCAPWSSLANYKYKVKIQPGAVKRGKAVKEILMRWDNAGKDPRATDTNSTDTDRIWPKEIELIRGWKEAEVVGVLPVSKVRVMMAGGGGGGGGGGGAKGKKSGRGGRGSKKR